MLCSPISHMNASWLLILVIGGSPFPLFFSYSNFDLLIVLFLSQLGQVTSLLTSGSRIRALRQWKPSVNPPFEVFNLASSIVVALQIWMWTVKCAAPIRRAFISSLSKTNNVERVIKLCRIFAPWFFFRWDLFMGFLGDLHGFIDTHGWEIVLSSWWGPGGDSLGLTGHCLGSW